jgi:hypothetical protein
MPVHDWKRVPAGIFHDFHHEWISSIKHAINHVLPPDYYALAEQHTTGPNIYGPDVRALKTKARNTTAGNVATLTPRAKPKTSIMMRSDEEFYREKKKNVVIRHVSGDQIIAIVEIVSQGNKTSPHNLDLFLQKASALLAKDIHLLIVDVMPPTKHDPHGIHAALWEAMYDVASAMNPAKPLTAAAYECTEYGPTAYVEPFAVGDKLPNMPVFLETEYYVDVDLKKTYAEAFAATPKRWQDELVP